MIVRHRKGKSRVHETSCNVGKFYLHTAMFFADDMEVRVLAKQFCKSDNDNSTVMLPALVNDTF